MLQLQCLLEKISQAIGLRNDKEKKLFVNNDNWIKCPTEFYQSFISIL